MKRVWKLVATCFGIGYLPLAPGTAVSFAVVLFYKFFLYRLAWPYYVLLFLLFCVGGIFSSSSFSFELGQKDPRKVVVDEACGQLLVLFSVTPTWNSVLISFLLFRLFDIVKPFPIRQVERLPSGWGIVADDLVAGLMAKLILLIYLWLR